MCGVCSGVLSKSESQQLGALDRGDRPVLMECRPGAARFSDFGERNHKVLIFMWPFLNFSMLPIQTFKSNFLKTEQIPDILRKCKLKHNEVDPGAGARTQSSV